LDLHDRPHLDQRRPDVVIDSVPAIPALDAEPQPC
jgi:hypothetical protein